MADWPPKKNTAFNVHFPIYDADGDLVTAAASLDSEVSIDHGTFSDATAEATEIATSSGVYYLALTAGEMNGDIITTITKTSTAGAKTAVNVMYTVTRQLADLAYPATTGRSMVVDANGLVDANTVKLGPTGAGTAQTARDVGATLGAAGAGLTAVPWNAAWDAEVQSEAQDAITASALATAANLATVDTVVDGIATEVAAVHVHVGTIDGHITADYGATEKTCIDLLDDAAGGLADIHTDVGTAVTDIAAVHTHVNDIHDTDLPAVKADTAAILVDTAVIGALGAGLTGIPWNAAWDAEVQSEVDDALIANNLDHLALTATVGADMTAEVADNTILSRILGNGDTSTFVPSTDGLHAAGVDIDAILLDTGTTLETDIDAILADTNELQGEWVDGGRLDLILDARASQTSVDTIDGIVDSILADTGTDGVIVASQSAAACNAIADALLKRDIDQVEATAALHSLTTAILKAVSRIRDNAGTLEVYRTDGVSLHMSQTITTDAGNAPIDELTAGV